MDLVVFVVLVCQILRKPALQATLRVFGLCGSCVDHVWSALRFLEIVGKDINVPGKPGCGTCDFCGSVV